MPSMKRHERRGLTRKVAGYFRDARVPRWRKLAGLAAVLYLFSPVDVVPDVIPLLGWLDDMGVLSAAALWLWKDVQQHERLLESQPERLPGPAGEGEQRDVA